MVDITPALQKTPDYLKDHIKEFKMEGRGVTTMLVCPFCQIRPRLSCNFLPGTIYKMKCFNTECKSRKIGNFTILDVIKEVEEDKKDLTDIEIAKYLAEQYDTRLIQIITKKDLLQFFESQSFDLVPIATNQKVPVEKDWTNKNHKDMNEWKKWLEQGLNIGLKTGKISKIIVMDIDVIPGDLKRKFYEGKLDKKEAKDLVKLKEKNLLLAMEKLNISMNDTLCQETFGGVHLCYQYDEDFPKTSAQFDSFKVDIETNGGQIVIEPSIVGGEQRKFTNLIAPSKMPEELKELLISKISNKSLIANKQNTEKVNLEEYDINKIIEGEPSRNLTLIKLGGILRKQLNPHQTNYVLDIMNRNFVEPPLSTFEFRNLVNKLDDYIQFDESVISDRVLDHLKLVESAFPKELQEVLGENREKIDKVLAHLVKEELVYKARRMYHIIRRAEWRETLLEEGKPIDFVVPYFNEVATFRESDMIVIGGQQKIGKSHMALNIVKQLVDQGIKSHYITTESGNRFATIAMQLGLKEGDFKWCVEPDPASVKLENNHQVTIIDWLLPKDYAETDKLYKSFIDQLIKVKGILIVFAQLRGNNQFFASDMMSFFPALVAKYILNDDNDGEYGAFEISHIREPKGKIKRATIPCKYNFETKILEIIENVETKNE